MPATWHEKVHGTQPAMADWRGRTDAEDRRKRDAAKALAEALNRYAACMRWAAYYETHGVTRTAREWRADARSAMFDYPEILATLER
jgi:hypothetical protein